VDDAWRATGITMIGGQVGRGSIFAAEDPKCRVMTRPRSAARYGRTWHGPCWWRLGVKARAGGSPTSGSVGAGILACEAGRGWGAKVEAIDIFGRRWLKLTEVHAADKDVAGEDASHRAFSQLYLLCPNTFDLNSSASMRCISCQIFWEGGVGDGGARIPTRY